MSCKYNFILAVLDQPEKTRFKEIEPQTEKV